MLVVIEKRLHPLNLTAQNTNLESELFVFYLISVTTVGICCCAIRVVGCGCHSETIYCFCFFWLRKIDCDSSMEIEEIIN
jgi:hypothetical protein